MHMKHLKHLKHTLATYTFNAISSCCLGKSRLVDAEPNADTKHDATEVANAELISGTELVGNTRLTNAELISLPAMSRERVGYGHDTREAGGCASSRQGGDAQAPRHPTSPCCFERRDGGERYEMEPERIILNGHLIDICVVGTIRGQREVT